MTYPDHQFFHDLKTLAGQDLSQAHLRQHFTGATLHLDQAQITKSGSGTWSSFKKTDTVVFKDNTLTGKKHWISGVSLCDWSVIASTHNDKLSVVLFDTKDVVIEPCPTMGMENTLTAHVVFDQTPATLLYSRDDARCFPVDNFINLSFLTIQLGLMESLLKDIDSYTVHKFDYEKKKLRIDVEIMNLLWNRQVGMVTEFTANDFKTRDLIYGFGKKTLTAVVNFVTEVTGSGLYETQMPTHQRYKDALIYCSHMKNTSASLDLCFDQIS